MRGRARVRILSSPFLSNRPVPSDHSSRKHAPLRLSRLPTTNSPPNTSLPLFLSSLSAAFTFDAFWASIFCDAAYRLSSFALLDPGLANTPPSENPQSCACLTRGIVRPSSGPRPEKPMASFLELPQRGSRPGQTSLPLKIRVLESQANEFRCVVQVGPECEVSWIL